MWRPSRALTRQLLAFSSQQVIQPVVLDPTEVIGRLEPMLEQLLPENVELTTHFPTNGLRIDADWWLRNEARNSFVKPSAEV